MTADDAPPTPAAPKSDAELEADDRAAAATASAPRRWLVDRGGLLVVLALIAYLALAPTLTVDGDNAELATVGALGGRAHPSGYPAYVLWLRLTSWLPGASAAHTTAIATALLAVGLVAALLAACRAWAPANRNGRVGAAVATALYAASPVVLREHTQAEVFAMNGLVVALVLLLAARRGPVRGLARGALLGLVAGIGLGDHLTCVFVAPVGILGVVRAAREARHRILPIALAIAGLAIGLCTYLYLLVADGPVAYGHADGLADLVKFFTRDDYGGPGTFASSKAAVPLADNLLALAATLGRAYLYAPAVAGVAALVGFAVRSRAHARETAWAWRALLLAFVLAGPVLVSRFNIAPTGLGLYVDQRFYLLPLLLLAPAVAAAIAVLPGAVRATPAHAALLATAVFAVLVAVDLPHVRAQHSPAVQRGIENLLRSLPERAVLVWQSDDVCMIGVYLQRVEHLREDVSLVCWDLTGFHWYRARFAGQLEFEPTFTTQPSVEWVDRILASGRRFFTDRHPVNLLVRRPSFPYGLAVEVRAANAPLPTPKELVDMNREIFAKFDLDYPKPGTDDDWATLAQRRYMTTWALIGGWLDGNGDHATAAEARALAASYAPVDE